MSNTFIQSNKGKENNFKTYSQAEIQHLGAPYDYGT